MKTGHAEVHRGIEAVRDRLTSMLAAANCEILSDSAHEITFRHGTYLTESAPLLPKTGAFQMRPSPNGTMVNWRISVSPFAAGWMTFVAIVFCWTLFAPILVHRALTYHPARFMQNLVRGL